jgi:septal ring factor EnvC (AmiA/AmiB activator)
MFAETIGAQDVKPDELKNMRAELKAAQDRKAELSTRVAELEKQNQAQAAQLEEMKRQAAGVADRTLFLSAHYAAWTQFIAANPAIKMRWELFEQTVAWANVPPPAIFMDPNWPLSVKQ